MTFIRHYLHHQAVFQLHFLVKCLLLIWPIDLSMLMDYEIFLIFIPTKIWSLVSNTFLIFPSYYFQMIILINKALIEHLLRVWTRTQSLVKVKCFQLNQNQTFKIRSENSSSLQLKNFVYNILFTVTAASIYHSTHWVLPAQSATAHTRKTLSLPILINSYLLR